MDLVHSFGASFPYDKLMQIARANKKTKTAADQKQKLVASFISPQTESKRKLRILEVNFDENNNG